MPATTSSETAASLPATSTATSSTSTSSQPFGPDTEPDQGLSLDLLAPPTDAESIRERLVLVGSRLAELIQVAPTASAPASQPGDEANRSLAQQLYDAMFLYRSELLRWQAMIAKLQELKNPETIEALTQTLQKWKEQREFYENRRGPALREATAEHIEAVEREYRELDARLADLTTEQTSIEQRLATLRTQKDEMETAAGATLDQLKQFIAGLPAKLSDAGSAQARTDLFMRKRMLEWRHNLQLLRAAAAADARAALELQLQQNASRIGGLAPYVRSLREYRNRLEKAKSMSAAEYAADQLAQPDLPEWKRTYWEAVLHASEGLRYFQELDDPTRSRFPKSEADQLEQRILRGKAYWQDFMESIDRRPGGAIMSAYRRSARRLAEDRELLESLQQKLDQTLDEQRLAMDRQTILQDRNYNLRRQFDSQIEDLQGENLLEARKLQTQLTSEVRAQLNEKIQSILSEQQALRERLKKSITLLSEYIDLLSRNRSAMYWSHLFVGGDSLIDQDWKMLGGSLREVVTGKGLMGDVWRRYWQTAEEDLKAVQRHEWTFGLAVVLTSLVLGLVARRRLIRQSQALQDVWIPDEESRKADFRLPFKERFTIEITAAAGRVAPVVLPLLTFLALAAYIFGQDANAFTVTAVVVLTIVAARAALAWIHMNFATSRPASRLVPCPQPVAAYHQRWLTLLVVVAAIVLPIPIFLERSGLLPNIGSVLMAIAVTSLLCVAFVYVLRRKKFIGVAGGDSGAGVGRMLIGSVLPMLPLGVAGLIGLAVAGYEALAVYILTGFLWSILVIWTVSVLWELLHLVTQQGKRQLDAALAADESEKVKLDPDTTHPLVFATVQVASVAVVVVGFMVLLYGWGISPVELRLLLNYEIGEIGERPVQLWRPVAAVAAIAVFVIVSRAVRAFLQTKVFPQAVNLTRGGQAAILTILNYALIGLGVYVALHLMNLRLGALAVLLGTLGLGLGLGLQPLFVNFISGLLILFERQIKVGDIVMVGDQGGEVTAISTRSTKIRTPDNIELDVPNAEFVTNKVVNWSMPDRKLRTQVDIRVAYDSDERLVHRVLMEIAQRNPLVLPDPPPSVWFLDVGADCMHFAIAAFFADPGARWNFMTTVRYEILEEFRKHGIKLPTPRRALSTSEEKSISVRMLDFDGNPERLNASASPLDEKASLDAPSQPPGRA